MKKKFIFRKDIDYGDRVACRKLNRKFIGIEIDKDYYDGANQRLKNTKLSKPITKWISF